MRLGVKNHTNTTKEHNGTFRVSSPRRKNRADEFLMRYKEGNQVFETNRFCHSDHVSAPPVGNEQY